MDSSLRILKLKGHEELSITPAWPPTKPECDINKGPYIPM